MGIKFNPKEISADVRAKMSQSLMADTSNVKRSPFTELGQELGIDIFGLKAKGFVNDSFIAYLPKMPAVYDDSGKRVKWATPVTYHTLRVLGNGNEKDNYVGRIINTRNRTGFEEFGISGNPTFIDDYLSKSWEYKSAHDSLVAAREGFASLDDMPEDARKNLIKEGFKFMPISQPTGDFYFPIVIIETEKDENGKSTMIPKKFPVLNEDGTPVLNDKGEPKMEPRGHMMWYRTSEKTMKERFPKALKPLSLGKDDDIEGYIYSFDYTIREDDSKKSSGIYNTEEMKSANSLVISVIAEFGNNANLYKLLRDGYGLFDKWDAEANENYNELMLPATVVACELESDEEVKAKLDKHYGDIDVRIEELKKKAQFLLSNAGKSSEGLASVGGGASEAMLGISLEGDDDDVLNFDKAN